MNKYLSCETCDHNIYQIPDGKTQWCCCDICEAYDMHSDNALKCDLTLTPLEGEQRNEVIINNAYGAITHVADTLSNLVKVVAGAFTLNVGNPNIDVKLFERIIDRALYTNNKRKYTGKPLRRNISKRYREW